MDQYEIQIGENRSLRVARVMPDAHWQWLAKGWVDFKATWRFGLLIGAVPVLGAWVMVFGLWYLDMLGFIPAVCGGFALVGPILAIGCYQISRSRDAGERIELKTILKPRIVSPGQVAVIGFGRGSPVCSSPSPAVPASRHPRSILSILRYKPHRA
jgi:uncharacterized membrane protein